MAEALELCPPPDQLPVPWRPPPRGSRKSGCSHIFSGTNLQQLHRLFRTAGDRNAEHRAKRVWRGMGGAEEGKERGGEEEEEEEEEDAGDDVGLAQALVGLRVRARSKSGLRMEGHREPRWHKASGYLRVEEPLSGYTLEDEEVDLTKSAEEFQLPNEEDIQEKQNPFKPSSWRLGVRLEGARDSDRYLHRILH